MRPAKADQLRQSGLVDRLNALRGMAWAYAVLYYTGLSASKASIAFSDHRCSNTAGKSSNIMYQYLRGIRAPTIGSRGKLGFDLVGAVDRDPKGKRATPWLTSFLWEVFHPDTSEQRLCEIAEGMTPALFLFIWNGEWSLETEDGGLATGAKRAIEIFDDFVIACAHLRAMQKSGHYFPDHREGIAIKYLAQAAAKVEPVFALIYPPFITMVDEFIFIRNGNL